MINLICSHSWINVYRKMESVEFDAVLLQQDALATNQQNSVNIFIMKEISCLLRNKFPLPLPIGCYIFQFSTVAWATLLSINFVFLNSRMRLAGQPHVHVHRLSK